MNHHVACLVCQSCPPAPTKAQWAPVLINRRASQIPIDGDARRLARKELGQSEHVSRQVRVLIKTYLEVALQKPLNVDRRCSCRRQQVSPPELVLHHQLNIVATEPEPLLPARAAIPLHRQLPTSLRRLADLAVD